MAAGEYLSDDAVRDLDKLHRNRENPLLSSALMFISYIVAGALPIIPLLFTAFPLSLYLAIALAFGGFFLLGFIKGRLLGATPLRNGLKTLVIGGLATLLGLVVGYVFKLK